MEKAKIDNIQFYCIEKMHAPYFEPMYLKPNSETKVYVCAHCQKKSEEHQQGYDESKGEEPCYNSIPVFAAKQIAERIKKDKSEAYANGRIPVMKGKIYENDTYEVRILNEGVTKKDIDDFDIFNSNKIKVGIRNKMYN